MAQEQGSPGGVGSLLKGGQSVGLAAGDKDSELSYLSGAHIIIPGAAAALLGGHALQGLGSALPLSRPLDLSALGTSNSPPTSFGGTSILSFSGSPLGMAKAPLLSPSFPSSILGLPMVPMPGATSERRVQSHLAKKGVGEEAEDEVPGGVLNLSTGGSHDPLSWVVIPPGAVVLKPAVVN